MNSQLSETLSRVAGEVFELLAFVLLAREEEPSKVHGDPMTAACISFSGQFGGVIVLAVSTDLLPIIAANMLGWEDGNVPSPPLQRDALCELLNVICGNLLPAAAGDEALFDVGAAHVLDGQLAPPSMTSRSPVAAALMRLEGGWAQISLFAAGDVAFKQPVAG
jgi:hypothetical protein